MDEKLKHLPVKSRQAVTRFAEAVTDAFGDNLYSLFLFGSAARASEQDGSGEFKEGASDINTAIVLENIRATELNILGNIGRRFKKRGLALPLVFKRGHIASSLDTFPLEFYDMKRSHIVLHGADPLENAVIEMRNLRHQCEVQLKGQLVLLRRGYLAAEEKRDPLSLLISSSVTTVLAACQGMAIIKGEQPPGTKSELLRVVHQDYNIDTSAIEEAWRLKRGELEVSTATLEMLFDRYTEAIEKLAELVDRM